MKNKHILFLVCSLILSSFTYLSAKEFKVISLDNFEKIEKIKFQDISTSQHIILKKYYPNRSFMVPANDLIYFYGINPDTGASSNKPLLRVSFVNQKSDSILLLRSDKDSSNNISYEFLENDPTLFPELSAMILNLSDKKVIANIGGEIMKIDSESQKLIHLPKNERGTYSEKVVFAAQKNTKDIDYFYSSFWRVQSAQKILCIVDYDAKSDSHKLVEIPL